jgi:hypothetical protein
MNGKFAVGDNIAGCSALAFVYNLVLNNGMGGVIALAESAIVTIPNWGRLTPTQGFMLMLAGHVLRPLLVEPGTIETDDDRLEAMNQGREYLCKLTKQDFGYDLARWHEFLVANDQELGYTHPYAWKTVKREIEKAIGDPDRLRLVRLVEKGISGNISKPENKPGQSQ